jgi:hypothetical protein
MQTIRPSGHSLIADDRRSAVARAMLTLYRHSAPKYGREIARDMARTLRLSGSLGDGRRLNDVGIEYGPGRGLRGRCRILPS